MEKWAAGADAATSGHDHLHVIALVEAAYTSAESNTVVQVAAVEGKTAVPVQHGFTTANDVD